MSMFSHPGENGAPRVFVKKLNAMKLVGFLLKN
jgi:hypothetical protein